MHVLSESNHWGNLASGPDTQGERVFFLCCYEGVTNVHDVRNNVLTSFLKGFFLLGPLCKTV